jgi:hypothetical protein
MPKNAITVNINTKDFQADMKRIQNSIRQVENEVAYEQANEILRTSIREVPHDIGNLQNTGDTKPLTAENGHMVFYDTDYAAKMHENPQFDFQKGRKAKYLEDPIKRNETRLQQIAQGVGRRRLSNRIR